MILVVVTEEVVVAATGGKRGGGSDTNGTCGNKGIDGTYIITDITKKMLNVFLNSTLEISSY